MYGLIADAVLAGYIEGSTISGGIIQIGLQEDGTYAFEVLPDGSVVMNGGSAISGYAKEEVVNQQIKEIKNTTTIISNIEPDNANDGQMWLDTSTTPYSLFVFADGKWVYFSQQDGKTVYTSEPEKYFAGDLWILADGEIYGEYGPGGILKADENLNWIDATSGITDTIVNVKESFSWDSNGIKIMKRTSDNDGNITNPFYVHIDSTRMGFHSVEYDNGVEINDVEVVHIGNNSATIQNATFQGKNDTTFENNAMFNKQINMYNQDISSGFAWKIEENGSLSLAII
jgi:hypothetical protein